MVFFDVEIKKISEIIPIEGADFVELGKVEGMAFQFVVKKDDVGFDALGVEQASGQAKDGV